MEPLFSIEAAAAIRIAGTVVVVLTIIGLGVLRILDKSGGEAGIEGWIRRCQKSKNDLAHANYLEAFNAAVTGSPGDRRAFDSFSDALRVAASVSRELERDRDRCLAAVRWLKWLSLGLLANAAALTCLAAFELVAAITWCLGVAVIFLSAALVLGVRPLYPHWSVHGGPGEAAGASEPE